MSGAPANLEQAVTWLREQAARLNYGRASIEVICHAGKITRIISLTENSVAGIPTATAGADHGDRER
ncbi:MAG: hypothetical protein ABSG17_19500 [Spirochaetia bacterium]|jgi:hypothetical protein